MKFLRTTIVTKIASLSLAVILLTLTTPATKAFARPGFHGGPGPLPLGHAIVHIGALAYYFVDGLFYRHSPRGYVVVPAPAGAVVTELPQTAEIVTIDGRRYYTCAGAYYKKTDRGYLTVAQPVAQLSPAIVPGQQLEVSVDLLNVRSGPGFNHAVLEQIRRGTRVEVEAVTEQWCLIHISATRSGWINHTYTIIADDGAKG